MSCEIWYIQGIVALTLQRKDCPNLTLRKQENIEAHGLK